MDYSFCFYTQASLSFPHDGYKQYVASFINPLIQTMLNQENARISFCFSDAFINYLDKNFKEVNLFIQDFLKSNRMEMLSSSYNNKSMSSLVPRNRMSAVDKCTTIISKLYSTRAVSAYYGSIWNTNLVNPMALLGLESLIISSSAVTREIVDNTNFRMNKNGKKINVLKTDSVIETLILKYSNNEITYSELDEQFTSYIDNKNDDTIIMINIDQVCKGDSFNSFNAIDIITKTISSISKKDSAFSLPKEIKVNELGYLDSAFYSHDVKKGYLTSPNQLFVTNGTYRYYENRVLALYDLLQNLKKTPTSKKSINELLLKSPSNSLYYLDATASCLRGKELQLFYNTILEAQRRLSDYDLYLESYDLDDDEALEYFLSNKTCSAVLSTRGAGLYEFCSIAMAKNVLASVAVFDEYKHQQRKAKSFTDKIAIKDKVYDLKDTLFTLEKKAKNKAEYTFSYTCEDFTITKNYKLSNCGIALNSTITNNLSEKLNLNYVLDAEYNVNKKEEDKINDAIVDNTIVKYPNDVDHLTFTSSDSFSFTDKDIWQKMRTCLGEENFYLCTQGSMSFDLELEGGESKTVQIKTKFTNSKEY